MWFFYILPYLQSLQARRQANQFSNIIRDHTGWAGCKVSKQPCGSAEEGVDIPNDFDYLFSVDEESLDPVDLIPYEATPSTFRSCRPNPQVFERTFFKLKIKSDTPCYDRWSEMMRCAQCSENYDHSSDEDRTLCHHRDRYLSPRAVQETLSDIVKQSSASIVRQTHSAKSSTSGPRIQRLWPYIRPQPRKKDAKGNSKGSGQSSSDSASMSVHTDQSSHYTSRSVNTEDAIDQSSHYTSRSVNTEDAIDQSSHYTSRSVNTEDAG